MSGKFIFVSGLSGAGKSTLVRSALDVLDNFETVVTYVTRPPRSGEEQSHEYIFVSDQEYEELKSSSKNWDETLYAGYKYGADGAKYFKDLHDGVNVIVAVAPDINIIRGMAQKYGVQPTTIWIDVDQSKTQDRIKSDDERSKREESAAIKDEFDIIFKPTENVETDSANFIKLLNDIVVTK